MGREIEKKRGCCSANGHPLVGRGFTTGNAVKQVVKLALLLAMVSFSCDFVILLFLPGALRKVAVINSNDFLRFVVFDDVVDDSVGGCRLLYIGLAVVFAMHHLLCRKIRVKLSSSARQDKHK